MKDDDHPVRNKPFAMALPAWLMVIGGTVASMIFPGAWADVGLVVALLAFIVLLVLLQRTRED
jgi:ABC-type Fe3+-siderophore transport system permease subunit